MKKLILLVLVVLSATLSYGQFNPQEKLQLDSTVRVGQLENGLKYFIKKNNNPENRAEFYIATNVGAIQETPAQRGLAHFLEHMCFNGNKDFPGNTMLSYLEKNGLIFGANINAMTGVEMTVYTLNAIPTERKALVDTALVILQNDAAFVTNSFDEIEKERGVIIEEWRSGNTAARRQQEAMFKVLYKGSKYADCNVIGDEQCLSTFDPQELVNFYKTWYYPANQAIIVAGDVDVDYVEKKIKELFSIIPKKENPPVKEKITVPHHKELRPFVFTDPELSVASFAVITKTEAMPKEFNDTGVGLLFKITKSLLDEMIYERLSDASKLPGSTFISPSFSMANLNEGLDVIAYGAAPKEGKNKEAIGEFITVLRQIEKYGFTAEEFERAKASILRSYQSAEDKAATRTNSQFAMQYVNYFLKNEPYCEPAYLNSLAKTLLSFINVDMINSQLQQGLFTMENSIVTFTAPKKEGIVVPTEQELVDMLKGAYELEIKPLENVEIAKELLDPSAIKAGKIKKSEKGYLGSTVLTLSNGINVYLYPTDIRKDRVTLDLSQPGGRSILPQELLPSFEDNIFSIYESNAGVADFSANTLRKMLAGKSVSASHYVQERYSGVAASASTKDLESAFQLLYLNYTSPRCNAQELENTMATLKVIADNLNNNPQYQIYVLQNEALSNNHPRSLMLTKELLERVNAENINKGNSILFGDAAGAKLFITGDFEIEQIKPMIEKYIASLPVKSKKARHYVDHKILPPDGIKEFTKNVKMENPNSYVTIYYSGEKKKDVENNLIMRAMSYILNMRYITSLREEDGGTYSPAVNGSISSKPNERYQFMVYFETQKDKAPVLINKVYAGLEALAADGPTEEELTKTIEMIKKNIPESKKEPSYWTTLLQSYYEQGYDLEVTDEKVDKNVTKDKVQKLAKEIAGKGNRLIIAVYPE